MKKDLKNDENPILLSNPMEYLLLAQETCWLFRYIVEL